MGGWEPAAINGRLPEIFGYAVGEPEAKPAQGGRFFSSEMHAFKGDFYILPLDKEGGDVLIHIWCAIKQPHGRKLLIDPLTYGKRYYLISTIGDRIIILFE